MPSLAGRMDDPRFGLSHALGVAALLHLLFLLAASAAPDLFLGPGMLLAEEPVKPPPVKFTFIDVPDDNVVEKNPDAALISDKDRVESGPTPEVTTPQGKNPPSRGNTPEKIAGGAPPSPPPPRTPPEAERLPRPATPRPAQPQAPKDADEPPRRAEEATAGPGAPGVADAREEGKSAKQQRFSRALDALGARPALPTDLQAVTPPEETVPGTPGSSTRWSFDNPDPAFPVRIGSLSFDSKGADFGPWLAEFHRRVLSEWTRNLDEWRQRVWREIVGARLASDAEKWNSYALRMNNTRGVTGVVFQVTREGSVVALDVIHASGTLELDRSVQKTLRNVLLPPLPPDYPDESLQIQAGFYYNVAPPE